jgi:dynein intermediate chain
MADSATRAQRAAALEEKRRKLEELKKSRSRRSEDAQRVKVTTSANLDEYIDGLLMSTATTMTPAAAAAASTAEAASTDGGKGSVPELVDETTRQESSLAAVASFGPSTSSLASNAGAEPAAGPPPPVTCFVETFSVATQTEEDDFPEPSPSPSSDDAALLDLDDAEDDKAAQNGGKDGGQRGTTGSGRIESGSDGTEVAAFDPKLLSPDQVQKEVSTGTFSSFLNTASKKVERVLGTPLLADLMVELGADDAATTRAPNLEGGDHDSLFRRFVSSRIVLQCPRWTSRRDVTDLDWSPFHREMILTTHHSPTSRSMAVSMFGTSPVVQPPAAATSPADGALALSSPASVLTSSLVPRRGELESAGLACVWSLAMPGRPEHVFTAGSPVTSGRFHPSDSSLIVGGLESGQLVVWDVRAGRLPVQKSALASTTVALSSSSTPASSSATKCHTYPLTGMEIIEGGVRLSRAFCVTRSV